MRWVDRREVREPTPDEPNPPKPPPLPFEILLDGERIELIEIQPGQYANRQRDVMMAVDAGVRTVEGRFLVDVTTGVVSFALQLVLAKLIVLSKLGLSLTEILSDALGFAISVVGLVLTTQAATENSRFTASPFAVLSATAAGVVVGFIFYLWGQSQEVQAAKGRSAAATKKKS